MIEEEIIANLDNILTALVPGEVSDDDNLDNALGAGDDMLQRSKECLIIYEGACFKLQP